MTVSTIIGGTVVPGGNGIASLPFVPPYVGGVGIRERDDLLELAYFGPAVRAKLPLDGTLDGEPIRIVEISQRALNAGPVRRARSNEPQWIVVTAVRPIAE